MDPTHVADSAVRYWPYRIRLDANTVVVKLTSVGKADAPSFSMLAGLPG